MAGMADLKLLADAIFWVIHYDTVTPQMYMLKTGCTEQFAMAAFVTLHKLGLIVKDNPNDDKPWFVTVSRIEQLPNDMINMLSANGHDLKAISEAIKGLPKEKKKPTSNILKDKAHKWIEIDNSNMPTNPVLIRLCNPGITFVESRTEIIYAEDLKIAEWDGGKWVIRGPYPLHDYSPCTDRDKINGGVDVTHWAEVTDKELEQWDHRYDSFHNYDTFSITVDDEMKEKLYHALVLAASALSNDSLQYPPEDETHKALQDAYEYICDLQVVFDRGGDIHAVDKK